MKEQLLHGLLKVSLGTVEEDVLPNLLRAIRKETSCQMCSFWKINRRAGFLSIQAREGYNSIYPDKDEFILPIKDSLLGDLATELELSVSQQPYLDIPTIREPKYWKRIKHKEFFAERPNLNRLIVISIPILLVSSSEQSNIEAILAIYPKDNDDFKSGCADIIRDFFSLALSRLHLIKREQLVQDITHRYEKRATKDLASILYPIVNEVLRKYFRYEGCSVFQDEGLTGYFVQKKEIFIVDDLDTQCPQNRPKNKWPEKTNHPAKTFAGIPLKSSSLSDELLGVIRFTNSLNPLTPICRLFQRTGYRIDTTSL